MAQMKQSSKSSTSSNGEGAGREARVLASCYLVDNMASLTGFHYCTTLVAGAECPPLAAITATNQFALLTKKPSNSSRGGNNNGLPSRRGGATLRIREECERFFCETMKAVFQGERDTVSTGSGLTGVYNNSCSFSSDRSDASDNSHDSFIMNGNSFRSPNGQLCTPPNDYAHFAALDRSMCVDGAVSGTDPTASGYIDITAWLEVWDYIGGTSIRGFLAEGLAGEKSLFAFFDTSLMGQDLKQGLMALIELADSALDCDQLVICVDRAAPAEEASSLMKGLQWAGFSMTTLDVWTGGKGVDVTSLSWVFMGMEL